VSADERSRVREAHTAPGSLVFAMPPIRGARVTRRGRALLLPLVAFAAGCAAPRALPATPPVSACVPAAAWVDPATRARLSEPGILDRAAAAHVVLLGERHDSAEDHRWQLQTLAALLGRRGAVVVGFEMLPRRAQPVLDRWAQDGLSVADFLSQSRWDEVWGHPAELYLPLFHFVRMNRLPARALNVDRALVERVGHEGWAAVAPPAREGLSDPAPASPEYAAWLKRVYALHQGHRAAAQAVPADDPAFRHFVEAQLVWDRAFAEGLAAATREHPAALVVGIIGSGHLEHGFGVRHQLASLDQHSVVTLVPWDAERDCGDLVPGLADAVFGVAPPPGGGNAS